MMKFFGHMFFIAAILGAYYLNAGSSLTFEAGKTVTIVCPDNITAAEKTACMELMEYLEKLSGGHFPIVGESEFGDSTEPAIFVGETAFAKAQGIDVGLLGREEWILRSSGNRLIITGGAPRGTYYAVLEFLELHGVVWPDELSEYVPPQKTLIVDALDIRGEPAIAYRRITLGMSTSNDRSKRFFARCRRNDIVIPEEFGFGEEQGGCHTFHDFTSPDWPDEYFSLSDGKRTRSHDGGGPGQLCMSNREMQKAVLARLRARIAKDRVELPMERWPRIYDISQNDNENYCTCAECSAIAKREGGYSGVLLEFINFVARGIRQDYPDVMIQTFAYTHTLKPPKFIRPEPNVLVRVCKIGMEFFPAGRADTLVSVTHPRNKILSTNN